jgi:hypothetical protein
MNEITQHDFGLLRREVKDLRGLVANVDHRLLRLIEGGGARTRPIDFAMEKPRRPVSQHHATERD